MVKNPLSSAGDVGSISGWGTKIPHAVGQLSPCATARETCGYHSEDPAQPKSKKRQLENPAATELQPVATTLNLGLMVQRPAPPSSLCPLPELKL